MTMGDHPNESIVLALAKELHWQLERGDPSPEGEWDELSEQQRKYYVHCIEHLLLQEGLLRAYLGMGDST